MSGAVVSTNNGLQHSRDIARSGTLNLSSRSTFVNIVVLALCLALLFVTQFILNLSDWFKLDLTFLASLQSIACLWNVLCSMRLPQYSVIAFGSAVLAAILFGARIAYLRLPLFVSEFPNHPARLPQWRWLKKWPVLLTMLLFLVCQVFVVWGAIQDTPINIFIWVVGLIAALLVIWQLTGASTSETPEIFRNSIYVIGMVVSLLAIAALVTERWWLAVVMFILALAGLGGAIALRWQQMDWATRLEHLALPTITIVCFLLMSYGIDSWAWAFLGDEYAFYNLAKEFADGKVFDKLLSGAGVYGYHPVLSSAWQGTTMWLFGSTGYGWRVSHSLAMALSIPLFYYFLRQFTGRRAAVAGVLLYGSAHVLLSFGKLGSNNVQVIAIMALSWAAFIWSARRGSLVGFAFTGLFVGLGFYTFAVARVYSLLIAIWMALYYFPIDWQRRRLNSSNVGVWIVVVGLAVLTALPVLSTRSAWEGQLRQTLFTSEVAFTPLDIFYQFLQNTFYSFTSFLYNNQNAVFVYGAHADPITASLMVLGLGALIFTWRQDWRLRTGLLATYLLFMLFVGSLQQYGYPNITRMFSLIPFYAIFACIGLVALYRLLITTMPTGPGSGQVLLSAAGAVLIGVTVWLNVWMSTDLSQRRVEQKLQAMMLQTAQLTADHSDNEPNIYYIAPPDEGFWMDSLFAIYSIPKERYTLLIPRDVLQDTTDLCRVGNDSSVVIMPANIPDSAYLAGEIQRCWEQSQIRLVKDGRGEPVLYRVISANALPTVRSIPGYWIEEEPPQAELNEPPAGALQWEAYSPRGMAVALDGRVAVVEAASQSILFFDADGRLTGTLSGLFIDPSDVAFTTSGDLIVSDAGAGLFVMDLNGHMRTTITAVSSPRGIFVTGANEIYTASTGNGRIAVFNLSGDVIREIRLEEFKQPTSVAVSITGRIAVGDPVAGKVMVLDSGGVLEMQFDVSEGDTSVSKPGVAWLPNGNLLYTDPGGGRLILVDQNGQVLQEWDGLQSPNDVVVRPDNNQVYLLEAGANHVVPITLP